MGSKYTWAAGENGGVDVKKCDLIFANTFFCDFVMTKIHQHLTYIASMAVKSYTYKHTLLTPEFDTHNDALILSRWFLRCHYLGSPVLGVVCAFNSHPQRESWTICKTMQVHWLINWLNDWLIDSFGRSTLYPFIDWWDPWRETEIDP